MANIIGSKIGGSFRTLSITQNNNLVYKTDKSEIIIPNGMSRDKWMIILRPEFQNDQLYYPLMHICKNYEFSIENAIVYDPKNDSSVRSKFLIYNNGEWGPFIGSILNIKESPVLCDMSEINIDNPYFVKWSWVDENGNNYGWTEELFVPYPSGDIKNED